MRENTGRTKKTNMEKIIQQRWRKCKAKLSQTRTQGAVSNELFVFLSQNNSISITGWQALRQLRDHGSNADPGPPWFLRRANLSRLHGLRDTDNVNRQSSIGRERGEEDHPQESLKNRQPNRKEITVNADESLKNSEINMWLHRG